jgi:hypothetical protein
MEIVGTWRARLRKGVDEREDEHEPSSYPPPGQLLEMLAVVGASAPSDVAEMADVEVDVTQEPDLLADAARRATSWGADRFAEEFRRREEEERRLRGAEAKALGFMDEADTPLATATHGPVSSEVERGAVEPDRDEFELHEPIKHAHVPRPPAPKQEPEPKRGWRRRKRRRGEAAEAPGPTPTPTISAQEWARMSPGARKLYGIEDAPERRPGPASPMPSGPPPAGR